MTKENKQNLRLRSLLNITLPIMIGLGPLHVILKKIECYIY